jgi:hypothetical protein
MRALGRLRLALSFWNRWALVLGHATPALRHRADASLLHHNHTSSPPPAAAAPTSAVRSPHLLLPPLAMAQGSRGPPAASMPPNGSAHAPTPAAAKRKKQKQREKTAAKKAAQDPFPTVPLHNGSPAPQYADADELPYDDDADFYSDEEVEHYEHYAANGHLPPGFEHPPPPSAGKKPRRKKKAVSAPPPLSYAQHHHPAPAHAIARAGKKDPIWNTSTVEERERIREFWLSLGEDERKSLVKIEKEAVLRKMKEQQKHSCSCSVCGRKRTAIEEELEVLYDAYYEELEQYAHHQQDVARCLPDANFRHACSPPHPRPLTNSHAPPGRYDDDEDEEEDEEDFSGDDDDEEEYSNSEISSDGDGYDSEERSLPSHEPPDFMQFGNSLQVKGTLTPGRMCKATDSWR